MHAIQICEKLSYYGECNDLGMEDTPTKQIMRLAAAEIRRQHYVLASLRKSQTDLLNALSFVMTAHGEQLTTAFECAHLAIEAAHGIKGFV